MSHDQTILIADVDVEECRRLRAILQDVTANIEIAVNMIACNDRIEHSKPDLIILSEKFARRYAPGSALRDENRTLATRLVLVCESGSSFGKSLTSNTSRMLTKLRRPFRAQDLSALADQLLKVAKLGGTAEPINFRRRAKTTLQATTP